MRIRFGKKIPAFVLACLAISLAGSPVGASAQEKASKASPAASALYTRPAVVTPVEAMKLLEDGNKRFMANKALGKDISKERRMALVKNGQGPFVAILSCADSRMPPELVFDQGLGDLFVLRVAGNILVPVITGSIEFSQSFNPEFSKGMSVSLIVVMGHDKCGAVHASVDGGTFSDNIAAIAQRIMPAVEAVKSGKSRHAAGNSVYEAVTLENVDNMVNELKANPAIAPHIASGKLQVVGARYMQESGKVEFMK